MHAAEIKNTSDQRSHSLWWLHPFWIVAVPLLVISLVAYLVPESDYRENWRTPKAFNAAAFGLCVAVATAFSAGCLLASLINAGFSLGHRIAPGARDVRLGQRGLRILFAVAFVATIAGYTIWFGSILRVGGTGMLTNMLTGGYGASDKVKTIVTESTILGVSKLAQLGMGTALLGTYLGFAQGWHKVRARLALLLSVAALRAFFLSERLALLEVVLPSVILMIRLVGFGRPGSALRRFLIVAPVVGIVGLYGLFTFTEYFRSWSSPFAHRRTELLSFSMLRLLGYYVTALNNGAIEWQALGALHFPYSTMSGLWKFPVVGGPLQRALGGTNPPSGEVRLALSTAEGNPELNSPSGIFVVFTDFGVAGALLYFAMLGCGAALLYGSYRRGSAAGIFLYSFLFVGLTEQLRNIYISEDRALPTWLLLLCVAFISRSRLRRATNSGKPAARADPTSAAAG